MITQDITAKHRPYFSLDVARFSVLLTPLACVTHVVNSPYKGKGGSGTRQAVSVYVSNQDWSKLLTYHRPPHHINQMSTATPSSNPSDTATTSTRG